MSERYASYWNAFLCIEFTDMCLYYRSQGGAVIRAARRMAERVGYDPETGLHSGDVPQIEDSQMIIQDGE